jgi:NAD-dependent SIR2 family protein deacetylase
MVTIDPNELLALSVHDRPGVYALLLGSGVSRSAGIPTGWEIVVDLLRKLAALQNLSVASDVELVDWYRQKYDQEPEYSTLLDAIARRPEERQQLLRPYFEPNDDEREQGLKQPTVAHRAIAQLAARGLVRVIVTTNFDRLIETALTPIHRKGECGVALRG